MNTLIQFLIVIHLLYLLLENLILLTITLELGELKDTRLS